MKQMKLTDDELLAELKNHPNCQGNIFSMKEDNALYYLVMNVDFQDKVIWNLIKCQNNVNKYTNYYECDLYSLKYLLNNKEIIIIFITLAYITNKQLMICIIEQSNVRLHILCRFSGIITISVANVKMSDIIEVQLKHNELDFTYKCHIYDNCSDWILNKNEIGCPTNQLIFKLDKYHLLREFKSTDIQLKAFFDIKILTNN